MNQGKPLTGNLISRAAQPKLLSNRTQPGSMPAWPASVSQPRAMNERSRTPVAPPLHGVQAVPKVLQAKIHASTAAMHTRAMAGPASGVVQANVIGGNHALQARLNLWNARLTRGASRTVGQGQGGNSVQASRTANGSGAIQRKTSPGVEAFQVPLRQKSGGLPIPDQVRAKMETAFSADFSDVRVHIGHEASSLGAIAYTWGSNIHFAPGQYNPNTIQGQKLLGHELWHVVQQRAGRVSNPFGGGVAVVQDHALEAEADRMGIKAAMTTLVQRPGNEQ